MAVEKKTNSRTEQQGRFLRCRAVCGLVFLAAFLLLTSGSVQWPPYLYGGEPFPNHSADRPADTAADAASDRTAGQSASEPADNGVRSILTRLGLIQEGIPEDRGETIFLRLPNSAGGLTISKLDILFVGRNRNDVFEYQMHQLPAGDVGSLLKFADWAGRNRLAPEAIALLKSTAAVTSAPSSRAAILERLAKMEYVERIKNEAVRRVQESAPADTASLDPAMAGVNSERDRLAAFAKQVPFSVEERFSRKIEPILLRRCAAAECHPGESGAAGFSLSEPSRAQSFRSGHLRNLEMVLDAVTFHRPETSPILNHPSITTPNGERLWPFGEDADSLHDYELFVDWVTSLGSKMKNYSPDPNRPQRLTLARGTSLENSGSAPLTDRNAGSEPIRSVSVDFAGSAGDVGGTGGDMGQNLSAENGSVPLMASIPIDSASPGQKADPNSDAEALRRAGYLPTERLRDEFDPAPFNRKYHPSRTAGGLSKKTDRIK